MGVYRDVIQDRGEEENPIKREDQKKQGKRVVFRLLGVSSPDGDPPKSRKKNNAWKERRGTN